MANIVIKFIINFLLIFTVIISIDKGIVAKKEQLDIRVYYLITVVVCVCLLILANFAFIKGGVLNG